MGGSRWHPRSGCLCLQSSCLRVPCDLPLLQHETTLWTLPLLGSMWNWPWNREPPPNSILCQCKVGWLSGSVLRQHTGWVSSLHTFPHPPILLGSHCEGFSQAHPKAHCTLLGDPLLPILSQTPIQTGCATFPSEETAWNTENHSPSPLLAVKSIKGPAPGPCPWRHPDCSGLSISSMSP